MQISKFSIAAIHMVLNAVTDLRWVHVQKHQVQDHNHLFAILKALASYRRSLPGEGRWHRRYSTYCVAYSCHLGGARHSIQRLEALAKNDVTHAKDCHGAQANSATTLRSGPVNSSPSTKQKKHWAIQEYDTHILLLHAALLQKQGLCTPYEYLLVRAKPFDSLLFAERGRILAALSIHTSDVELVPVRGRLFSIYAQRSGAYWALLFSRGRSNICTVQVRVRVRVLHVCRTAYSTTLLVDIQGRSFPTRKISKQPTWDSFKKQTNSMALSA
ncbi:hypothetical protein V8C34DRAFT_148056 [Trichoderma compactum]